MSGNPTNSIVWSDPPPRPSPGFEADVIRELERLVSALPAGTANMVVGHVTGDPSVPEPDFEITPSNPRAASIGGYAVATDLNLSIGHAEQEFVGFARGENIVPGAPWPEELRWIWEVIVAGGFTQRHYFNRRGTLIAGYSKIRVRGAEIVFHSGRRETIFGRAYTRAETVTYEPYIPSR